MGEAVVEVSNANAILAAVIQTERIERMTIDEVAIWRASMPTGFALAAQGGTEDGEELIARAVLYADSMVVCYRQARTLNEAIGVFAPTDAALADTAERVTALAPAGLSADIKKLLSELGKP